jgi:sugar lactone lactonase YvrE
MRDTFLIKDRGFILIAMFFMLVLMAVTAVALNRRAGLQNQMASNQSKAVQTHLGQESALEQALWGLTKDPCWRTTTSGEDYTYDGITYNRKVLTSLIADYTDCIGISATAPGGVKPLYSSFRYYLEELYYPVTPNQVCCDSRNDIYVADGDNHSIFKVDGTSGAMTRVAGNGTSGFSGDGGPAIDAQLNGPFGVWLGPFGEIYIADRMNHRIRKVDLAGIISTVAGTGSDGYDGDGGPATDAKLKEPCSVFVDEFKNIFIADKGNHCIRKVSNLGIITTVAGTGNGGYSGDAGPATSAELNKPRGVFVDGSENIYIADTDNHRIRKVSISGIITTVAGTGNGGYSGDGVPATSTKLSLPQGVYVDTSKDIYISDTGNSRIRKVDFTTGIIATVAGSWSAGYSGDGGPATLAQLDNPAAVCFKSTQEMVIADRGNSCLREVDLIDIISTLTSTGAPSLNKPYHIAMDEGENVYIADRENHRIRKLAPFTHQVTTIAGTGSEGHSGDGGPATSAELNKPRGIFVDGSENIYIADTDNHWIRKVDASTGIISRVAGKAKVDGKPESGDEGDGGLATLAGLNKPGGVAVFQIGAGPDVRIYIADTDNHRIRKVSILGIITTVAGTGSDGYSGDGGPATSAELKKPRGIFVDGSENIYIADTDNHCIRKVSVSAIITTVAGTGSGGYSGDGGPATSAKLNKPNAVFVDPAGNIYIADQDNNRVRLVSVHDQKIQTLAGTGSAGFNGDDQPAVNGQLNNPSGFTMSGTRGGKRIYLSDRDNNRIRILTLKMVKELY